LVFTPARNDLYEYLAEVQRDMPKETTPAGVTPADAVLGQFFYAVAREAGHAVSSQTPPGRR
jgi:Cu/Ag efflux pump CusA